MSEVEDTLEALAEGDDSEESITMSDLLGDAAQCLVEHKKPALAKACRMAREIVSLGPQGETWVNDIRAVLEQVDETITAAKDSAERGADFTLDLTAMMHAAEACANWGLDPGERLVNAITRIMHDLIMIRDAQTGGRHEDATKQTGVLLQRLGFVDAETESQH